MIRNRCSAVIFSVLFPLAAMTADIYDFIPRQSDQVIQINLTDTPETESIRKDLIGTVSRQTGFDGASDKSVDIMKDISKIVVVNPNLTEDETLIFLELKVSEKDFCRDLEKLTGSRHSTVSRGNRIERQFVQPENMTFFGIPYKKRVFAYAFPDPKVAVFAKNSLDSYYARKPLGLLKAERSSLQKPLALVAGFTRMNPQLLEDHPLLPPFYQTVYSLSAGQAGSVRLLGEFSCSDAESAEQVRQLFLQYVSISGFLLNQYDPELMREWMQQIKVTSSQTVVTVKGELSRAFLERLAAASEQMSDRAAQLRADPRQQPQGK